MKSFKAPVLHSTLLMGDDPKLLAQLSALVAKKGHYTPVLDGPRIQRPDPEAEIVRRHNAVARARPNKIVFAGLPKEIDAVLAKGFPQNITVNISSADDANSTTLSSSLRSGPPLIWGSNNIGIGLLKAMRQKTTIMFTEEIMVDRIALKAHGHLVVCEDGNEHSQVIAANYAYSLDAGLMLVSTLNRDEADSICEELYGANERRDASPTEILQNLRFRLKEILGDIPLTDVTGITFISKEIPWGFAFPEVPTTHLFSYPDLGISIINAMAAEQKDSPPMRVAVVVDPATLPTTEVEEVAITLMKRGILVRGFTGHMATVKNVSRMLELLPYDFLLIATHCGDAGGWRETYEFQDSSGRDRKLLVDTAIHISASPSDEKFEVVFFQHFVALDGVDWKDKQGLANLPIGSAMNDFYDVQRKERHPTHREKITRVISSAALQMHDGNLIVLPKPLADNLAPIILNNACTSWHRLASTFMFSNARAYIGTLFSVSGIEAEEIAKRITEKHFGKPLALALWHAQNEIYGDGVRRPYVMVGVHYQRLTSTYSDSRGYLQHRLTRALNFWEKRLSTITQEDEDKALAIKNTIEFLQFESNSLKTLESRRQKN